MTYALWLSLVVAQALVSSPDRVVAENNSGRITYHMIACGSAYRDPDVCHAMEQQRIDTRVHRQWIDAARKLYGVALTPEEEAEVNQRAAERRPDWEKAAARFRALAIATVRLRRGEDRSLVYAEASRQGVSAQDLDRELELRPTLADAERVAALDLNKDAERSWHEEYTRLHIIDHLAKIVARHAVEQHISFETAEEAFWSEVVTASHTRMLDPSYLLPARKGILFNHEQQAQIAH